MEVTGVEITDEVEDTEDEEAGTEETVGGVVEEVVSIETTDSEIIGMREVVTTGEIEEMTTGGMTEDTGEMIDEAGETGMMTTGKEEE